MKGRGEGRPRADRPAAQLAAVVEVAGGHVGGGDRALRQVRVPQADDAAEGNLPNQQVVHPPKGELQVLHRVALQVLVQVAVGAGDDPCQLIDQPLDARLREGVVVLDGVQQLVEGPVGVGLDAGQHLVGEGAHVEGLHAGEAVAGHVLGEVGDEEGRHEVVHALDVAAGRVADRPDVEDALEDALDDGLLEDGDKGLHARNVNVNLPVNVVVLRAVVVVLLHQVLVLRLLVLQGHLPFGADGGHVAQQQLPHQRPLLVDDAVPGDGS